MNVPWAIVALVVDSAQRNPNGFQKLPTEETESTVRIVGEDQLRHRLVRCAGSGPFALEPCCSRLHSESVADVAVVRDLVTSILTSRRTCAHSFTCLGPLCAAEID